MKSPEYVECYLVHASTHLMGQ